MILPRDVPLDHPRNSETLQDCDLCMTYMGGEVGMVPEQRRIGGFSNGMVFTAPPQCNRVDSDTQRCKLRPSGPRVEFADGSHSPPSRPVRCSVNASGMSIAKVSGRNDGEGALPGSRGEHEMQERLGTRQRASRFYNRQMLDRLNGDMRTFIGRQRMLFIGTADAHGECDCGIRVGDPGFVQVLDDRTLLFPDYRGNGVFASMGNILENGHAGLLFVDFEHSTIGLHVNGSASIVDNAEVVASYPMSERLRAATQQRGGKQAARWIRVDVEEAYIQCSKHIPMLWHVERNLAWGSDDPVAKGGDYFRARRETRPWHPMPDDSSEE